MSIAFTKNSELSRVNSAACPVWRLRFGHRRRHVCPSSATSTNGTDGIFRCVHSARRAYGSFSFPDWEWASCISLRLRHQSGSVAVKTDPYGTYFEAPPGNAAIVCGPGSSNGTMGTGCNDAKTTPSKLDRPVSVYELHLGSWRRKPEDDDRPLSYRELAPELADYVVEMGFTHVEIMPIAEHPFDGSWGYQVTGSLAPTHRFGAPEDFRGSWTTCTRRGIGVILDWVPAHFPRDAFALASSMATHLYEHADPRQGAHMDWAR